VPTTGGDVRAALSSAVPPPRRTVVRSSPVLDPWKATIDGWLEADKTAPRKQRHTARRVWQRLVEEHAADVGEFTVRRYVAEVRRRQSVPLIEVMVPQHHPLGMEPRSLEVCLFNPRGETLLDAVLQVDADPKVVDAGAQRTVESGVTRAGGAVGPFAVDAGAGGLGRSPEASVRRARRGRRAGAGLCVDVHCIARRPGCGGGGGSGQAGEPADDDTPPRLGLVAASAQPHPDRVPRSATALGSPTSSPSPRSAPSVTPSTTRWPTA
jgi:hypothetical protein